MKYLLILISLSLIGCSHLTHWNFYEPFPLPSKSSALLYVYHDCSKGRINGKGPQLFVNNVDRAYMPKGSYFATYTSIGEVNINTAEFGEPRSLVLNTQPNQVIYVKILSEEENELMNLKVIETSVASREITKCRFAKMGYYSSNDAT